MARAVVFAILFFLGGCAELAFLGGQKNVEFELSGRFAVHYANDASSGNLAWRHSGDGDELLITSPLGLGVARIVRDHDVTTLTMSDGRSFTAPDADSLTEKMLGFRLPLAHLAQWVRGRSGSGSTEVRSNGPDGRPESLEQDGWRVDFVEYESADENALPRRLKLHYPGLELRLAITQWRERP